MSDAEEQVEQACYEKAWGGLSGAGFGQIKRADREVEMRQVIITRNASRGDGTKENPFRTITQVWSLEGDLIAEKDPCK